MLSTAQIGRSGELLVQYRLLKLGIESAQLTTDNGIDLVAYVPGVQRAVTIQVKTNHKAKPAGGKGRLALEWWLRDNSPAQLVALVDIENDRVWIFTHNELDTAAQQHSGGRMHFYMYVDAEYSPRKSGAHVNDFNAYLIENRTADLAKVVSEMRDLRLS